MMRLLKSLNGMVPFFVALAIVGVAEVVFSFICGIILSVKIGIESGFTIEFGSSEFMISLNNNLSEYIFDIIYILSILSCGLVFYFWYKHQTHSDENINVRQIFTAMNMLICVFWE